MQLLSLFPPTYKDRANGNRTDLMEMMAAMHPAFLRMPGGNYLEGDHVKDRFDWKKTIGPLVDRPTHQGPWNYHSSDGMGLLEFLEWCEDLKMQPVLAVYAGYSLKQDVVKPGPLLEPFVQDALDEIEYVTGDASTKWGAERVKDGHPAPFPLSYVEIGNEDFFDNSKSYDGRYAQFYDAIKKKYPTLQLIATTPIHGHVADVVDDHYYKRAEEFFEDVHHYDATDRKGPKIFVGEWATRGGHADDELWRGAGRCGVDDRHGAQQRPDRAGELCAAIRERESGRDAVAVGPDRVRRDDELRFAELLRAGDVCESPGDGDSGGFAEGCGRPYLLLGDAGSGEGCGLPEAGECYLDGAAVEASAGWGEERGSEREAD